MATRFQYRVILVGVDFSAPSRQALARGLDLAERFGARLELVHVAEKLKPALPFSARNRAAVQRLQKELKDQARSRLRQLVPSGANAGRVKVHPRVITGVPDIALIEYAHRCKADLLVLANRGHNPVKGLLIGSTAERVLRETDLPVLLVSVPRKHG